ncbi:calcium-binding protein [Porphyrobacter sp. LM 6]|uniref:calcium-binding protein n=1 Tax=Porphyrobacter sp. LM 6 TaxID=1896196 RepID=UPI000846F7DC|nr:calcium-binding protein [Porphyrobacter sp. LM 6]AOL94079.1 YVTN family beta-propeller repeat protein [Porphyrobacter sp. LM 6]
MSGLLIATAGNEDWTLSADGTLIFVATNSGMLRVHDSVTGQLLFQTQLGNNLGSISLSPDGTRLAVIEEVAENVRQFQSWTENSADVSIYVVDLNTFGASEFTYTVRGSDWTFADVAWSDADTLQISRNILPGWSGWASLGTLELSNGSLTYSQNSYYAGLGSAASLLTMPGSTTVLLGQLGLSSAEYYLISPSGTSMGNNGTYQNNVYGYAAGIEAASGNTANDRIVIVTGGGVHVYTGTMGYLTDLTSLYPTLGNAAGVAFSPDGDLLYFMDRASNSIVVLDAYTYNLVATVPSPAGSFLTLQRGAELVVSADGSRVWFNTSSGIVTVTIDLPDRGTEGNDVLNGTNGADVIDGRGGSDQIYGLGGDDWLVGGTGDDVMVGGAGFDIAGYETAVTRVVVDLAITTAQATSGAGSDTLSEIEGLGGSAFNDSLSGNGAANLLIGLAGNDVLRGRGGDDDLYGDDGADELYGDAGIDWLFGGNGNDLLSGGTGADRLEGGDGDDIYEIDDAGDSIIETATGGNDTMRVFGMNATIVSSVETLVIMTGAFNATGNFIANRLVGSSEANVLTGLGGNDTLEGGGNVDTAVVRGTRSQYTVTQTSTGVFQVVGPDGTDTLTAIEFLQFDDQVLRLRPGTGVSVNFNTADPSVYQSAMNAIRDFDGNALGGNGSWLRIGSADVNGDGDIDQILVNRTIGRFATIGTAPDGLVYFSDHSWAGETRVAGIYIDPLVASGQVVAGSANDSQRRFQNDLQIENINRVLGASDYDRDGLQEVYFALTDGTAYLRAIMEADGNIRYANYQSQQEVINYLTANGFGPSTWAGWFPQPSSGEASLISEDDASLVKGDAGSDTLGTGALDAGLAGTPHSFHPMFTIPTEVLAPEFYG